MDGLLFTMPAGESPWCLMQICCTSCTYAISSPNWVMIIMITIHPIARYEGLSKTWEACWPVCVHVHSTVPDTHVEWLSPVTCEVGGIVPGTWRSEVRVL